MKRIVKAGQSSRKLQRAALNPPPSPEAATAAWRSFRQHGGGAELLDAHLLPEQLGLCGYSELAADSLGLGLGFHIEHVENKSQNPARTFDYGNLIVSSFSSSEGLAQVKVQGLEVFGGHATGKQGKPLPVDMAKFVSLLQDDGARYFAYLSNGLVEPRLALSPADRDRAAYTIELLNLNSSFW
jgi:uncharacterized protein (TIGR02646 family)